MTISENCFHFCFFLVVKTLPETYVLGCNELVGINSEIKTVFPSRSIFGLFLVMSGNVSSDVRIGCSSATGYCHLWFITSILGGKWSPNAAEIKEFQNELQITISKAF